MLDTVLIVIDPLPTPHTVTGGGNYCSGGSVVYHIGLDGSETNIGYYLQRNGTIIDTLFGTGDSLDFGGTIDTGVYTVIAYDTSLYTHCHSAMLDSSSIHGWGRPGVFTVAGGGAYCSGTGGVIISLSGSEVGIDYQLMLLGSPVIGELVHGTGSTFNYGPIIPGGTYTVLATNVATGCQIMMSGSAFIYIKPLPTVYVVAGAGPYCQGDTGRHVWTSGSISGIHYQLYINGVATGPFKYGTGSGIDFGLFTTTPGFNKNFSIIAFDTVSGCQVYMADSVMLYMNPAPNVYSVIGGGSYCAGGSGVTIGLSGSQTGKMYQLYKGLVADGTPVPGTGSVISFGLRTASGTYTVTSTDAGTGCVSNMTGSVFVIINPLPAIFNVTGGGAYCAGGAGVNVGLDSSAYGIHYQLYQGWVPTGAPHGAVSGGGAFSFGLKTPAANYAVIATDSITFCTDTMHGSVNVSINPLPPVHTVTGGGSYCAGEAGVHVGLNGSNNGIGYQLYNGPTATGGAVNGTGVVLDFGLETAAGTYIVTAIDTTTHCADTMSGSATVTIIPNLVPVMTLTTHPGLVIGVGDLDTVVATVTGAGIPTFEWYLNNNLVSGATTNVFVFSVYYDNDTIVCKVTSHGTCGGLDTSKMVVVHLRDVSVKQILVNNSDIRLMPNPNKGLFSLKGTLGSANDQEVYMEVTNTLGQVVYKNKVIARSGNLNEQIMLSSNLANGMYLLNLRSGTLNSVFHFVVEQ
jgi:Secretion system C-terminal sorting domain